MLSPTFVGLFINPYFFQKKIIKTVEEITLQDLEKVDVIGFLNDEDHLERFATDNNIILDSVDNFKHIEMLAREWIGDECLEEDAWNYQGLLQQSFTN